MSRGPRHGAGTRWVLIACVLLGGCGVAGASVVQEVQPAVEDLRVHDVTFQSKALSDHALQELDDTTAQLQDAKGYVKVVVLNRPLNRYGDAREFGDAVRDRLGGKGRVVVYAPNDVGISSNLDTRSQIDAAELSATDALNDGASYSTATRVAAQHLAGDVRDIADEMAGDGGGSGGTWLVVAVVAVLGLGALVFMWWASRRMRRSAEEAAAREVGAAEATVRDAVDRVANGVLELADQVDRPDAPPEAKAAFGQGTQLFTEAQELLESADTRPELEAAYPKVVEAGWHLDTARALLAGQPAPPRPDSEPLFPEPVRVTVPTPAAGPDTGAGTAAEAEPALTPQPGTEPHYRQPDASPWLTAAAMAAMAMLSQRGMSMPRTRRAMDDGAFGSWTGELPPSPSRPRGMDAGRRGMDR